MNKRRRSEIEDKARKDARRTEGQGNSYTAAVWAGMGSNTPAADAYRKEYRAEKQKKSEGN